LLQQLMTAGIGLSHRHLSLSISAAAAAAAGRPEFGDLAARWDYFQATFNSNRVRLACPALLHK
jgi:hypothetical protein